MAFYVKPPQGRLSLSQFHEYATTRLRFLLALCNVKSDECSYLDNYRDLTSDPLWAANSLCLQEGSAQDKASHFILQLLSCTNHDLQVTVLLAESIFFDCRLRLSSPSNITRLLADLRRHSVYLKDQTAECFQSIHETAIEVANQLLSKQVFRCFTDPSIECKDHVVMVNYLHVLPLVARRDVTMQKGFARINCNQVPLLLRLIFEQLVKISTYSLEATHQVEAMDSRMLYLQKELLSIFKFSRPNFSRLSSSFVTTLGIPLSPTYANFQMQIKYDQLDTISQYFPPCMRSLHQILRHRHRLRHDARVQYTLFLKEIGLPFEEALLLWKTEYSTSPCSSHSGCSHHWSRDERKYEYSLRHMYGLTGNRKNYSGQRCTVLQASCSSSHEGGCPFVYADTSYLLSLLLSNDVLDEDKRMKILQFREAQRFNCACALYLKTLNNNAKDFSKPAHFFFQTSK